MSEPTFLTADGKVTVFSYGSNSTQQLRGRVKNPMLKSYRARADGFARVFCLRSQGWGGGGVASLAPDTKAVTYGAMVELTFDEKKLLDLYEGGYREEVLTITVECERESSRRSAIAYVAGPRQGYGAPYTLPLEVPPTEQYLTAIHVMLREHYNMKGETITIRGLQANGCVVVISEWHIPQPSALGLPALCVELNATRSGANSWTMPRTIQEVVGKFVTIGACEKSSAAQLLEPHLGGSGLESLNRRLEQAGQKILHEETLRALTTLLLTGHNGVGSGDNSSGGGMNQQ